MYPNDCRLIFQTEGPGQLWGLISKSSDSVRYPRLTEAQLDICGQVSPIRPLHSLLRMVYLRSGQGLRIGSHVKRTFCEKTVHHSTDKFQLVLQAKVNEVGINEDSVWRYEGSVVCKK